METVSVQDNVNSVKFMDVLINEIKKRPTLWDKTSPDYNNRRVMYQEWQQIANMFNKTVDEVKTKWRNLRDTFHREEKKVHLPLVEEGKPVMAYYTGQWDKFEKLLFLFNTRNHSRSNNDGFLDTNATQIDIEHIKEELDTSENSYDCDALLEEQDNYWMQKPNNVSNLEVVLDNTEDNTSELQENARKRGIDDGNQEIPHKKRDLTIEVDIDEEMLIKSLVPFLRKLNPIKKLIARSELQNLLLQELLCERCRAEGLRPTCHCNSN